MSVEDLAARLPDIATLRRWSQSMAMLDAILSPNWHLRYYSFNANWGRGKERASMRDGMGNHYSITFSSVGAYGRGFDHESKLSSWVQASCQPRAGLLEPVPADFEVDEPGAMTDGILDVTLTLWRLASEQVWSCGRPDRSAGEDDGGTWLFKTLDGDPATFRRFALGYHEIDVDLGTLQHVFAHRPLTDGVVQAINPDLALPDLADDVREIGYPTQ